MPADNSTYLSGGNVYLTAAATDADGTISKVEFYYHLTPLGDGATTLLYTATDTPYTFKWQHVPTGNYILTVKATDNTGLVTTSDTIHISVVPNTPPTVNIVNPANGQTFLEGATLHLQAVASDADGRIGRVEFYNSTTLLATEYKEPYTFDWRIGQLGNYTITAKATDNWGAVTTSAEINVLVVPNQGPTVSIITPSNGQTFNAPATINLEAVAQDPDGRIVQVSFYNATNLLADAEHKLPYTYQWQNVPAGIYTISAVAKDNWSAKTTSAPITVTVTSPVERLVSRKPSSVDIKPGINDVVSMQLVPNPATNLLNIHTTRLQHSKRLLVLLLSTSGVIIQTKQFNNLAIQQLNNLPTTIELNVSSLASGVYIIKMISGDKVIYKQFVKL